MGMNRLRVMVRKFCPFGRFYFMVSYLTSGGGVICTKSVQSGKKRPKKNSSSDGSEESSDDTDDLIANAMSEKKQNAQHGKNSDKSKQPKRAKRQKKNTSSDGLHESQDDMDVQLARDESDAKAKMAKRKRAGGFCLFFVYFIFSISLWMYQLKMSVVLFFLLLLNRLGLYFHLDLKMIIVTILDVIIS